VFAQLKAKGTVAKAPVVEVLRRNWREVVWTALLRTGQQVPFYIFTTYIVSYGTQQLGFARGTILNFVMLQSLLSMLTIPIAGHLSDIYGRRRITTIGCVVMMVYPFIYFGLLDTRSIGLVFLAIFIALPLHDLQYGPQAAFIAESFPGSLRYSGSSLGYQLASITAGGPAPILAVVLMQQYGTSMAVATYVAVCAVISLISVFVLSRMGHSQSGHLDHQ
jgi:MFS family permease